MASCYICTAHNSKRGILFDLGGGPIRGRPARMRILGRFARDPLANDLGSRRPQRRSSHESPGWIARHERANAARLLLPMEGRPGVAACGLGHADRPCVFHDSLRAPAAGAQAAGCAISLDVCVLRGVHPGVRNHPCDGSANAVDSGVLDLGRGEGGHGARLGSDRGISCADGAAGPGAAESGATARSERGIAEAKREPAAGPAAVSANGGKHPGDLLGHGRGNKGGDLRESGVRANLRTPGSVFGIGSDVLHEANSRARRRTDFEGAGPDGGGAPIRRGISNRMPERKGEWLRSIASPVKDETGRIATFVGSAQDVTVRKEMEAILRESEDRYRDLVEHSTDLICTHTLDGRLLSVNELPIKVLGYTKEELLNKPMSDLLLPEAREEFERALVKLKNEGFVKGLMVVVTKSGERRIWEYHNTLRTEGVAPPIVRGVAHDVTEQKRMEREWRRSEEKFAKAFLASPHGIAITTLNEGRI